MVGQGLRRAKPNIYGCKSVGQDGPNSQIRRILTQVDFEAAGLLIKREEWGAGGKRLTCLKSR